MFPSPKVGIRLETRWTPTYIKTDPEGYWCDPYWGCYTVGLLRLNRQSLRPLVPLGRGYTPTKEFEDHLHHDEK